jgi:hypothetical protein
MFHKKSNSSTPEFIGRYNFNLDKGADTTLGMDFEKTHPILTDKTYAEVCECWEFANNQFGRCSFRGNPFDYNYNYTTQRYETLDENGNIIETTSDLGDDLEVRYHIQGDAIEGAWKNRSGPELSDPAISGKEAFNILLGGNEDGTERTGAYRNLEKFY